MAVRIAKLKPGRIMVSTPCRRCPFRSDVEPFLRPARVQRIWETAYRGTHFVCHETVDYGHPRRRLDPGRRACAGFLLMARREGVAAGLQIVQLAERLAGITLDHLRGEELVWPSIDRMLQAHGSGEHKRKFLRPDRK